MNRNGFIRYWDEEAQAPYLFDGHTFLTYDDPVSLECKCRLVRDKQIAGIMVWEYGYDEEHVLIAPMRDWLDA